MEHPSAVNHPTPRSTCRRQHSTSATVGGQTLTTVMVPSLESTADLLSNSGQIQLEGAKNQTGSFESITSAGRGHALTRRTGILYVHELTNHFITTHDKTDRHALGFLLMRHGVRHRIPNLDDPTNGALADIHDAGGRDGQNMKYVDFRPHSEKRWVP